MPYKPRGYTSAAPYLIVEDVRRHLDFLDRAFEGERLRFMERGDGSVEHAEYRIDDTVVMFGESVPEAAAHVHVYCADPDAVVARAADAGAAIVDPLSNRDDGDRRGGFTGPPGVVWWVARHGGAAD